MSTRCNILFKEGNTTVANIYRHCDGYPEGVMPDMQTFFAAVKEQCSKGYGGTRFDDPAYLAAKFVVWQASQNAGDPNRPLDFLSLGVTNQNAGDGEYVYTVQCDKMDSGGFPTVTHRRA